MFFLTDYIHVPFCRSDAHSVLTELFRKPGLLRTYSGQCRTKCPQTPPHYIYWVVILCVFPHIFPFSSRKKKKIRACRNRGKKLENYLRVYKYNGRPKFTLKIWINNYSFLHHCPLKLPFLRPSNIS